MALVPSLPEALAALLRCRWLVRAPLWLYRARLGFVFGSRLLMIEHIGRRSGLRRYVALEVVDHPRPDRWVVVSGFGDRAQWYRNLRQNRHVRVSVARHRLAAATATTLDPAEAAATLRRYAARHPGRGRSCDLSSNAPWVPASSTYPEGHCR